MEWLDALAECSEDSAELTRRYLTPEHARAAEMIMGWMREAGMSARLDAVGNVVGHFPGRRPGARRLVLGSHQDTVRNAGRFDGALGVLLPIACLRSLHKRGERLDYPVDVIAFGDEEGVRFQATLLGSQAVAGTLDPEMLQAVDEDGVRLQEAMREFGLDPDRAADAAYDRDEVAAYVEVHIEQGPVLEAEDLPVGVVTSISGAVRLRVEVMGRAGHAGTVPMHLRRDALAAASEAVVAIERICLDTIAARRGVHFDCVPTHESGARLCSPRLVRRLGAAVAAEGFEVRRLPSGAGHDAMAMADLTEVGMLFVRCKEGISHHPAESMTAADAEVAARVLLRFLDRFDADERETPGREARAA